MDDCSNCSSVHIVGLFVNVYDFDKTLYAGDSSIDFYRFCLKRQPSLALILPKQVASMVSAVALGKGRTACKEGFYAFLPHVKALDDALAKFWGCAQRKFYEGMIDRLRMGDVVVSASPEFLLRPICEDLGLDLIASKVDALAGVCKGENCRGEEKVRRFRESYPDAAIEEFYSDSSIDDPLARLADRAYKVRNGKVYPWR